MSDNRPVSILDATNQLISKVLGEHLQLTAEQIHMWAYNSIDLVGDVLQYFKAKSALSLYQGSTRAPLPGCLPALPGCLPAGPDEMPALMLRR